MKLSVLRPGQRARITTVEVTGPLRRRLMDMGVLVGAEVSVVKLAPLGGPLEVSIRNYRLSLRKSEAQAIGVEVLGG